MGRIGILSNVTASDDRLWNSLYPAADRNQLPYSILQSTL